MINDHMLLMIFNHAGSRDEECVRSSVDEKGKGYFLSRFTQCGFLCNERPQCNFLPRNSKNPIFSSETNFSSGSFPLAVRQVCALANRFQITRWIWIFIIYLSFDNPLNANLGKLSVFDFDLSWYPPHWEMGDYE